MRIIGPPSADRLAVLTRVDQRPNRHNRFVTEMFPALWDNAETYGIDPVGVVAQSAKETGWGTFLRGDGKPGKVKPEFHNTCGLKVTPAQQKLFPGITDGDNPLAHALFASWEIGARAHVQHLCAYAGKALHGWDDIVDPRYAYALKGPGEWVEQFEGLGTLWAPALDYGLLVVQIAQYLQVQP